MVKNPPAHSGDMGLIPGLGRSHMPQSNKRESEMAQEEVILELIPELVLVMEALPLFLKGLLSAPPHASSWRH